MCFDRFVNRIQETPPGKDPLDYLMWLRGITTADLAEKTGISQASIRRFRAGSRPTKAHRKLIAAAVEQDEASLWPDKETADA